MWDNCDEVDRRSRDDCCTAPETAARQPAYVGSSTAAWQAAYEQSNSATSTDHVAELLVLDAEAIVARIFDGVPAQKAGLITAALQRRFGVWTAGAWLIPHVCFRF